MGELTASWKVRVDGQDLKISFSRDTLTVVIDDISVECEAFKSDADYDVDLVFEVEGHKGHIYSDVEGSEMTNYLFVDDKILGQKTIKDCISQHKSSKKS